MSEDDTEFPIKGYKDLPEFTQVTNVFFPLWILWQVLYYDMYSKENMIILE